MDVNKIRLVQESFARVAPIAETAAALFYHRLFELDGSLKRLFHSDMPVPLRYEGTGAAADAHGLHRGSPPG